MMMKEGDNFKDQALALVPSRVHGNQMLCTSLSQHCGAIVDNYTRTSCPQAMHIPKKEPLFFPQSRT
jgi:hypothetical protein